VVFGQVFSWLFVATPLWVSLCLLAALGAMAWQLRAMVRRADRHARSIAHMDEWADSVDDLLKQMQGRAWRAPPPPPAQPRPAADARKWWQS